MDVIIGRDHFKWCRDQSLVRLGEGDICDHVFMFHVDIIMWAPLNDGMIVSQRVLAPLLRQTCLNICCRHRMETEGFVK